MQRSLCFWTALAIATSFLAVTKAQTDLTLVERANGIDVTTATIQKISRSQIFPDDYNFLERIAYIESEFGQAQRTPNDGGIWQVNNAFFTQSKIKRLQSLHDQINSTFGINWPAVTYRDLLKPLYSGLAASIYLTSLPEQIPQQVADQASFWLEYYNQRDYTEQIFLVKIKEMEEQKPNCTGKLDVGLVLDGSGSVGSGNFNTARNFVISLINTFSLNTTRVGFIIYSSAVTKIFPLENSLTQAQMTSAIKAFRYEGGGTNTNEAIRQAVLDMQAASARPGIPRALIVLTDGQSGSGVGNIELARQAGISTFGVGIGSGINEGELLLIGLNDPGHVFALTDFDALAEFFKRLNAETCALPQKPAFNSTTADEVEGRERRYYEYPLGSQGVTVQLGALLGQVDGYYSYTIENPSSAVNDGVLRASTQISNNNGASKVYLAVEGVQPNNLYTITVYEGKVGLEL